MISGLSHRLHRITSGVGLLVVLAACGDDLPIIDPPPSQPPPVRPIAGLTLEVVTTGVAFPVDIASPPGDPSRLFIVDKGGQVRVVRNGTLLATPFLDISNQVSTGGERGLLGIAFAPDYATSRR
ncbi:MAG: PQQ-dependent sugar dehydrogenase, partial [Gemmatimonadales bacterium]|nr:PQQ-dependent sugar dehydrogenase [Gemmatimonadales bacterium]